MSNLNISVKNVKHLSNKDKSQIKEGVKKSAYEQLKKQAQTVFNRVNKRIRNLESNKKVISPAYNALKKKRGNAPRFGTSGSYNDLKSLQKEYSEALAFDNMETSSIQGARNYTQNLKNNLPNHLDESAMNYIFDALHSLHERMPDVLYSGLLQYTDYLDTIVESAENIDLSNMNNYDSKLESIINNAIDKLTNQMSDKINEGIDILSGQFNRLF